MFVLELVGATVLLIILALGLQWLATNVTLKGK